jgi:hypothetical protein
MTPPEFLAASNREAVRDAIDRVREEGHATVEATL